MVSNFLVFCKKSSVVSEVFCFVFFPCSFHARLFLAECPLQAVDTHHQHCAHSVTVGPSPERPLLGPESRVQEGDSIIYVGEEASK